MRIFPEMWASTSWPLSSSTRNMALGSGSVTLPSSTIASSLGFGSAGPPGRRRADGRTDGQVGERARARPDRAGNGSASGAFFQVTGRIRPAEGAPGDPDASAGVHLVLI